MTRDATPTPPAKKPKKPKAKSRSAKSKAPAVDTAPAAAASTNGSTALVTTKAARKPPVRFSEEIAEIILAGLRDGKSLREICVGDDMPDESSVRVWSKGDTPFADQYRYARDVGYEKMGDDLVALADDQSIPPDHKRIMVDTRKWKLSKMLPKLYGDRLEVENKGGIMIIRLDAEDMKA